MFDSLRQLVTQLLSLLQVRIELLTTELSGELRRLAVILVWAAVGLLFVLLALLMIVATVIVAFWDTNRLLAVGLVALLFGVLAAWLAVVELLPVLGQVWRPKGSAQSHAIVAACLALVAGRA